LRRGQGLWALRFFLKDGNANFENSHLSPFFFSISYLKLAFGKYGDRAKTLLWEKPFIAPGNLIEPL
jgi:hypothetical protein